MSNNHASCTSPLATVRARFMVSYEPTRPRTIQKYLFCCLHFWLVVVQSRQKRGPNQTAPENPQGWLGGAGGRRHDIQVCVCSSGSGASATGIIELPRRRRGRRDLGGLRTCAKSPRRLDGTEKVTNAWLHWELEGGGGGVSHSKSGGEALDENRCCKCRA